MDEIVFPRLLRPQKSSFFLFGPRGCGKSTWLARNYPEARTVDLLDEARYQSYLAEPGLFFDGLVDLPSTRSATGRRPTRSRPKSTSC